jgi:chorismate-pyruvate lyase
MTGLVPHALDMVTMRVLQQGRKPVGRTLAKHTQGLVGRTEGGNVWKEEKKSRTNNCKLPGKPHLKVE